MNVSELYDLTYWITHEIIEAQIPNKYKGLFNILNQNAQPNQKQPFDAQKVELIDAIKDIPLGQLSRDQLAFLTQLGIAKAVGHEGVSALEDILYRNSLDIATAAQKVQEILESVNNGIAKSNQIKEGLDDCVFEEDYELENEILMRVSFTGNALMENVKDFKSWGGIWYEIGRGIAMAHNASPEEIRIVGATRGSIILELAVIASIATTTSGIIIAALKVAEKVLDIKLKAEELRGMKLTNKKLASDLDKEAENEKKAGIEQITLDISATLKINPNGEGDKVKALDTAVKNLVNFIEKGGVVDFVAPEEEEDEEDESLAELRLAFEEIRQLEKKVELLEHKIPNNQNQADA